MQLFDRATIIGTRRTRDGYLAVNARVARAGNVQQYLGYEVGKPEMAVVNVYRPAEEVFNKDTLASFAHRPVTLGHPSTAVTADTWSDVAKGWSDGEVAREGEFVRISMLLADAGAIKAVEDGTRQISMGYDCELDWTAGVTADGQAYDARQTRIRSNHVAIVELARGGPELRIGDSAHQSGAAVIDRATVDQQLRTRGYLDQATIDAEAAKPAYDAYRGLVSGSMPAEKAAAISNLLRMSTDGQKAQAAYDEMCRLQRTAYNPEEAGR